MPQKPTPLEPTIRPERPADVEAIAQITLEAFRDHPHGSHTEHRIVDALRRSRALSVSLVAQVEGQVVGHVAFSPVQVADGSEGWYALGPVSVKPAFQRRGLGQALVRSELAALRDLGAHGCVVVGEPGFYGRFGFRSRGEVVMEGVPQQYFMALPFGEKMALGRVTHHEAFGVAG